MLLQEKRNNSTDWRYFKLKIRLRLEKDLAGAFFFDYCGVFSDHRSAASQFGCFVPWHRTRRTDWTCIRADKQQRNRDGVQRGRKSGCHVKRLFCYRWRTLRWRSTRRSLKPHLWQQSSLPSRRNYSRWKKFATGWAKSSRRNSPRLRRNPNRSTPSKNACSMSRQKVKRDKNRKLRSTKNRIWTLTGTCHFRFWR